MKRDILFRAKKIDNKQWIEGWFDFSTVHNPVIWKRIDGEGENEPIILETVGQFIGLLDKKNNKIFEGDIIKIKGGSNYKVIWSEYHCGWHLIHAKGDGDKYGVYTYNISLEQKYFEIVGNIHDNPELLK